MKVPRFKNLKEEREFWDTHDSTDYHDDFKITKNVVFVRPKKERSYHITKCKYYREKNNNIYYYREITKKTKNNLQKI